MEGSLQWMREQSRKKMFQNFFAELLGTFILVLMGDGAIAQHVLSKGARGDFGNVSLGYGLALMIGITVSGGVSGGHLNPAVSLAMWVLGKMSRRGLIIYWAAQYIGAILASGVLLSVYSDAVHEFEGNSGNLTLATAGIWASFPSPNISATQIVHCYRWLGNYSFHCCKLLVLDSMDPSSSWSYGGSCCLHGDSHRAFRAKQQWRGREKFRRN